MKKDISCIEDMETVEMLVLGGRKELEEYVDKYVRVENGIITDSGKSFYQILDKAIPKLNENGLRICYVPPMSSWKSRNMIEDLVFQVKKYFFSSRNA